MGRGRCGFPLSEAERVEVVERLKAGVAVEAVAAGVGCSRRTVFRVWADRRLVEQRAGRSGLRLSLGEREQISRGLAAGQTLRAIARQLGRSASTVSREVGANGGAGRYRALAAERRAIRCAKRPRAGKLELSARLRAEVAAGLAQRWSPQQISARLLVSFPADPEMRISHETIYQAVYVQSRGELRRQLTGYLRTARTKRRAQRARGGRGQIKDMVLISERPAQIEDRAVPGHWEGDLILGARGASSIATLVERQTRFVMLARLGTRRDTEHVTDALKQRIAELPAELIRSLTWDQGKEMAAHARFSIDTGIEVFFCDPHSPWQRGSNENTNGLLRQYLPKSTDLAIHSQADLDHIAAELNGRPRQTLGWATPSEKMNQLLMR
jgi:transposase, IS30 family